MIYTMREITKIRKFNFCAAEWIRLQGVGPMTSRLTEASIL